jgi:hypothetical protein
MRAERLILVGIVVVSLCAVGWLTWAGWRLFGGPKPPPAKRLMAVDDDHDPIHPDDTELAAKYLLVKRGMTVPEVKALLGRPDYDPVPRPDPADYLREGRELVVYSFRGPSGYGQVEVWFTTRDFGPFKGGTFRAVQKHTIILYAARSETSSNSWNFRVINEANGSA